MVLLTESIPAVCSNPGERDAVETLLSMRHSICPSSGDESSRLSEDDSRYSPSEEESLYSPSPPSSVHSSDEDSVSDATESNLYRKNSKLARVTVYF
jgi:hypothetical protein